MCRAWSQLGSVQSQKCLLLDATRCLLWLDTHPPHVMQSFFFFLQKNLPHVLWEFDVLSILELPRENFHMGFGGTHHMHTT